MFVDAGIDYLVIDITNWVRSVHVTLPLIVSQLTPTHTVIPIV